MKKIIILSIVLMLVITIFAMNVNAACYTPYNTPTIIDDYDGFSDTANSIDDDINTYSFCTLDGHWINYHYEGYYSLFRLVGIRLNAYEKSPGGTYDVEFNVEVDNTNEGNITFVREDDGWAYYNFTNNYVDDAIVNLTFIQNQVKGRAYIFEIDFIYIYVSSAGISNLYPDNGESCVSVYPNMSFTVSTGVVVCCDIWTHTTVRNNDDGDCIIYEHNYTISACGDNIRNHWFYIKNASTYGQPVNLTITVQLGGGDYDYRVWRNKSISFTPEICKPPEGMPPFCPIINELDKMDCWETFSVFDTDNYVSKVDLVVYNETTGIYIKWNDAVSQNLIFNGVFSWSSDNLSYDNITVVENHKGYFFYEYVQGHKIVYNWSSNSIVDRNDTSIDATLNWVLTEMNSAVQWNGQNITWLQTHDVQDYYYNETGCVGIVWVNYTDENVTFNVSVDKSDDSNTSTYELNEDNWLFIAGFEFEDDTLSILLTLFLFAFFFSEGYQKEKNSGGFFMFISGFIWFALNYLISSYLNQDIIIPLMGWIGIAILIFGILKWFYYNEEEKKIMFRSKKKKQIK